MTLIPFIYTIYTLIIHKIERRPFRRKPKKGFYNIPTLLERTTHSQERNPCSLFSFPLPILYLEKRFIPKHNPHLFRVQKVFQSLGSIGYLPKEAGEIWQCNRVVLWDPDNQWRQDSEKFVGSWSLKGSSTLGKLGLEGLFDILVLQLTHQWIISTWRVVERSFAEFFGVLFDSISLCYLGFSILLPTALSILALHLFGV